MAVDYRAPRDKNTDDTMCYKQLQSVMLMMYYVGQGLCNSSVSGKYGGKSTCYKNRYSQHKLVTFVDLVIEICSLDIVGNTSSLV